MKEIEETGGQPEDKVKHLYQRKGRHVERERAVNMS